MTATTNALAIAAAVISASQCFAGFVTIDTFTNPSGSDNHGNRTINGMVRFSEHGIGLGYADMVGGVPQESPIATLSYSFLPSPLVVKPIVIVTARNMQTSTGESGILRARINGGEAISRELPGAQSEQRQWVFDFTQRLLSQPADEVIADLRLDWLRPDNTTGARQLWVESIIVADVPEPPTFALIATCLLGVGAYQMNKVQRNRFLRRAKRWPRN